MKFSLRVFLSLAIAAVIGIPPLLAARPGRADAQTTTEPQRQVTPFDRGGQSEHQAPDASAPERPARVDGELRITPFCEPVPETFFIDSLGSIATDLGTAGFVIDKPGRYVVTRDLSIPDVDFGILVRARNVILDLRGHRIRDGGRSIVIRVDDTGDVAIRDGVLKGGAAGVVATGQGAWHLGGWLTLQRLRITGDGQDYRGIDVAAVRHVEISGVEIRAGGTGVSIQGRTFNSRIVGSRIEAVRQGIWIENLQLGHLLRNRIKAQDAVIIIDGEGSQIIDNEIVGAPSGTAALRIIEGNHFIRKNRIRANGASQAMAIHGTSMIEGNELSGGMAATLALDGFGSRVTANDIQSQSTAVVVSGGMNLLEKNLIRGEGLECGLDFESEAGHVYRDNAFHGAMISVCGEPNTDGGGNEISAWCGDEDCQATTASRALAAIEGAASDDDAQAEAAPAWRARRCEPGEVVMLSEPRPGESEHGDAALLIDVPGYYLVTRDLELPQASNGIIISGRDVTLDLGGHTVHVADGSQGGRVVDPENVIIRNGTVTGGQDGLRVYGAAGAVASSVRIERMATGGGPTSSYDGLEVYGVEYVEILDSFIGGDDLGAGIYGMSRGRIAGNEIGATKSGLSLRLSAGAVLRNNKIRGDYSLHVGNGHRIFGNIIESVRVYGGANIVSNNVISRRRDFAIQFDTGAEGCTVRNSIIKDDVQIESVEDRLQDSIVLGRVSHWSGASRANVVNNLIAGDACGLEFYSEGGHQYRDNVVTGVVKAVCGSPNEDAGGNVMVPSP